MEQQIAKAAANELEDDDRVVEAEVSENDKGIFVMAHAKDRMAARSLKGDLHEYPVYIEVKA
jgi:hypothetical protein